jgi:PAS domain S-box-containing protein
MKQRSLRLTTIGPVTISVILILVFVTIYLISARAGSANIEEGLNDVSLPILTSTSKLMFNPLYNLDITSMTGVLEPYVDGTTVVYGAVYDTKGTQIMEINKKWAPDKTVSQELSKQALNQPGIASRNVGNHLILAKSIAAGTTRIGTIEMVFDKTPLQASLGRAQTTISITLIISLFAIAGLFIFGFQFALRPLNRLAEAAQKISNGDLDTPIPLEGSTEVHNLATTLANLVATVRSTINTLEERVTERTKALATSTEVSRRLSLILDRKILVKEVVDQLQLAFHYYHVQLYLLDPVNGNMALAGGTGEAGQTLLSRGHHVQKGRGLVGRAAETRETVLVPDTSVDPAWLPNPFLPETRSEIAVPILAGEEVLGVLDVQNNVTNSLGQHDADLIGAIASQVAVALQNSNLYAKAEASAQQAQSLLEYAPDAIIIVDLTTGCFTEPNENAERLYGLSREELTKVGPAQMSPPFQPDGRDSTEKALEKIGEAMKGNIPIFEWTHRNAQGKDIPCEVRLVRLPGDLPRVRASVTDITERKRIEELSQRREQQQEALNLISQKIQQATTVEAALQITVRELGRAMGTQTGVRLKTITPNEEKTKVIKENVS